MNIPKSTVLIVDDRPENLLALEVVLKSDYHLISANSGQEALDILQKTHVDVILLDIQMPGMDGYETAHKIKEIEHCRETPLIFITAIFTEDPHVKKGYQVGAVDFFTKPFDPDILKRKVAIYASFRQKDRLLQERESRLKESEALLAAGRRFSEILKTLPVGVIIADTDGGVFQINDEVLKILECQRPLGCDSYGEFLNWWSADGSVIKKSLANALVRGLSTHNEIHKIRSFDKDFKTVLSSVSPLRGLDNRIVGAATVLQDITQHKKAGDDMEKSILELFSSGGKVEQSIR